MYSLKTDFTWKITFSEKEKMGEAPKRIKSTVKSFPNPNNDDINKTYVSSLSGESG